MVQKFSKLGLRHTITKHDCHFVCLRIFLKMVTKFPMTKHCLHLHLGPFLTNGQKTPYNLTFETLAPKFPHITLQFFVIEFDSLHPTNKHNTCNGNTTILFFWPSHTHNQTQNFYFQLNFPIILNTIFIRLCIW